MKDISLGLSQLPLVLIPTSRATIQELTYTNHLIGIFSVQRLLQVKINQGSPAFLVVRKSRYIQAIPERQCLLARRHFVAATSQFVFDFPLQLRSLLGHPKDHDGQNAHREEGRYSLEDLYLGT